MNADDSFWKWVGGLGGGGLLGFLAWCVPKLYRLFLADRRATSEQQFTQASRLVEQCIGRMDRMDSRISELQMKQADCEARHAAEVYLHNRCRESRRILRVKMKLIDLGIGPSDPRYLTEYERLLVDTEHHPDDAHPRASTATSSIGGSVLTRLPIRSEESPLGLD